MDKTTRQDLILRLISEKELGTQQDVAEALSEAGVEVAQATVSRDLAELGVNSNAFDGAGGSVFGDGRGEDAGVMC